MPRLKLDPRQFAPEIAPHLLVALTERVTEFGIAPERLYVGLGFGPEDLRAGMLISNRQAWRMIRRALQLTHRADFGFEVGHGQNVSHFGLTGWAMTVARDFGEAIELGIRYHPQGGALTDMAHEQDDTGVMLIAQPRLQDSSVVMFLIEELFSSLLYLIRDLLGDEFAMQAIELTYPAPAHAERYRELFGCEPRFRSTRNSFTIARHWLSLPMPDHSPDAAAQSRALLEQHAAIEATDTVAAVERVLSQSAHAALSIPDVAHTLDLSVRTLRRRLTEAGTTFRALSDRVRAQTAQRMLREEGLTVAETSERLGFSDARAFRRAFKRWLGQAPGEVRHSVRA